VCVCVSVSECLYVVCPKRRFRDKVADLENGGQTYEKKPPRSIIIEHNYRPQGASELLWPSPVRFYVNAVYNNITILYRIHS